MNKELLIGRLHEISATYSLPWIRDAVDLAVGIIRSYYRMVTPVPMQEHCNGIEIWLTCPECGAEASMDACFCSQCGQALCIGEEDEE